jgi:hypothetical protein
MPYYLGMDSSIITHAKSLFIADSTKKLQIVGRRKRSHVPSVSVSADNCMVTNQQWNGEGVDTTMSLLRGLGVSMNPEISLGSFDPLWLQYKYGQQCGMNSLLNAAILCLNEALTTEVCDGFRASSDYKYPSLALAVELWRGHGDKRIQWRRIKRFDLNTTGIVVVAAGMLGRCILLIIDI